MEQLGYFTPQGADTRSPGYTPRNEQSPSTRPQQAQREDFPGHPTTSRAFGMGEAASDARRGNDMEELNRLMSDVAAPTRATPIVQDRLHAERPAHEEPDAASSDHYSQPVPPPPESILERRRRRQRSAPSHAEASVYPTNSVDQQSARHGA